jgi:hypothetical protein
VCKYFISIVLIVSLFQENKSFGASTICIHPLMYMKPCREQYKIKRIFIHLVKICNNSSFCTNLGECVDDESSLEVHVVVDDLPVGKVHLRLLHILAEGSLQLPLVPLRQPASKYK